MLQNKIYFKILSCIKQFILFCIGKYNKLVNKKCFFIIISGPPAIGKNTVCSILINELKQSNIKINFIKSYTTRNIRNNDDAHDYHFISKKQFIKKVNNNEMLEYIINQNNQQYYGFSLSDINYNLSLRNNSIVIPTYNFLVNLKRYLEVKQIKYCKIISVYLLPNSIQDIEDRIRFRGSESEEEIKRRINSAKKDIETSRYYDIQIVNKKSYDTAIAIQDIILKNYS